MKEKTNVGADAAAVEAAGSKQVGQLSHAAPPRPRHSSREVRMAAAEKIADELLHERPEDFSDDERETMIRDLESAIGFGDGYEIARDLEYRGWCPDRELVEKLDGGYHLHNAYDEAVRLWVVRHQIHPQFAVGDRVVYDWYRGREYSKRVPIEGEITRVERFKAQYLIFVESEGHVRTGLGTHGTYINFEDVRPVGSGNQTTHAERAVTTVQERSAED